MKHLTSFLLIIVLSCSSKSKQLEEYYSIVNSADEIKYYYLDNNIFKLEKDITTSEWLNSQKSILKRNIEIENQKEFIPHTKIEIYRHKILIGTLLISESDGRVNFNATNISFDFKETYGIGMSL